MILKMILKMILTIRFKSFAQRAVLPHESLYFCAPYNRRYDA
jgi:hypothetical protein